MYLDFLENRIKYKKEGVSTLTYDQTPLKTDISLWFFALSTKDLQPH